VNGDFTFFGLYFFHNFAVAFESAYDKYLKRSCFQITIIECYYLC